MTMSTFSWVLLENAKVSSFYSPKAGPIEKRDTQTDRRTDTRTNKHQILGTLYTKGPKGQIYPGNLQVSIDFTATLPGSHFEPRGIITKLYSPFFLLNAGLHRPYAGWAGKPSCRESGRVRPSGLLPFRAFCVEGPQNLMFVRPCVCLSVCLSVCLPRFLIRPRSDLLLESKNEESFEFSSKTHEKVDAQFPLKNNILPV